MTASDLAEARALNRLEYIGEDRADKSRQLAALGVMSSMTKLGTYDPTNLLPNPPPKDEQTAQEMYAAFADFSGRHNAKINGKVNRNPEGVAGAGQHEMAVGIRERAEGGQ